MTAAGLAMACLRAAPPTTNGAINRAARSAAVVAQGQEIAVANTIGMLLRQVYRGRKLSELALDVDTLRFQLFVDKVQGRRSDREGVHRAEHNTVTVVGSANAVLGSLQILQNSALNQAANNLLSVSHLIYLYQNEDRKEEKELWECGARYGRGL